MNNQQHPSIAALHPPNPSRVNDFSNSSSLCHDIRETEDGVIKIPDLMLLNKVTDRKFELGGGFTTDPKYFILIFVFSRPSSSPGGWLRPGLWGWSLHQKGEQVEINKKSKSYQKYLFLCHSSPIQCDFSKGQN